jgi:replicative DNA helicase
MPDNFHPADVLFLPAEAATATRAELEYRRANKDQGINLGIAEIDRVLNPVLSDNLVTILGRPGSGKTGFMMRWARTQAQAIAKRGEENKVVLYITYEQSVEDLTAFNVSASQRVSMGKLARGNTEPSEWDKVIRALTSNIGLPLAIIGHSKERRQRRPRLTMTNVLQSIEYMIDKRGVTPHMIFVDYLQRIPGEKYVGDRRMEVSESLDRCKDGALTYGSPWVVGVQAKRDVDQRKIQVPVLDDGQETSNIEQASDCVFSLTRPSKYRKEGEAFGSVIVEGHTQMLVMLLKQKLGRDNMPFWIDFDPEYNELLNKMRY